MNKENIIQKQILYLDVHTQVASPFAIQQAASKWCSEVLVDAIGRRLEKYAGADDVICIDKIEIELNTGEPPDEVLAEKIASEIEREIQLRIHSEQMTTHTAIVSKERTMIHAFIFFLQNGYLPWWSSMKTIADLISRRQFYGEEERRLIRELLRNKTIATRFATSLPLNVFISMLSLVFEMSEKPMNFFFQKIEKLLPVIQDKDLQYQFLLLVKQQFIAACVEKQDEDFVISQTVDLLLGKYQIPLEKLRHQVRSNELLFKDILLDHILANRMNDFAVTTPMRDGNDLSAGIVKQEQLEKFSGQKLQLEKLQSVEKRNGIYIGNAGLILLAPFIPRFFENLGIVGNNIFNSKDLALAMLQWLVTGNELHAEFDLVLPKIICGMEPEEPVIILPHLPEGFKKEGEILLQSVIEHWNILKNTSIAGFRESFLQREGKLSFQKDEWLLQVEQKPFDMLLESLPWNINMIRLSWMRYLLRTEWIG